MLFALLEDISNTPACGLDPRQSLAGVVSDLRGNKAYADDLIRSQEQLQTRTWLRCLVRPQHSLNLASDFCSLKKHTFSAIYTFLPLS